MSLPYDFTIDTTKRSARANMQWYGKHLMRVLYRAKENHAREADVTIALGNQLIEKLNEKLNKPVVVPLREVELSKDDSLMKPIEPELIDNFYNSTEKGGDFRYLKERNKKAPEDKFFFRIVSSWDYGWQQKSSRVPARDVNHGRKALMKETFYRRYNAAPDPPHYAQPAGGQVSICSEYSCNAN